MIVNVFSQPYELLVLLYGGMLSGLVYEFLRFGRLTQPRQTPFLDGLFVLLGGFVFLYSLLMSTQGVLRWYVFAIFSAGMWMSKVGFRCMFTKIYKKSTKNSTKTADNLVYCEREKKESSK